MHSSVCEWVLLLCFVFLFLFFFRWLQLGLTCVLSRENEKDTISLTNLVRRETINVGARTSRSASECHLGTSNPRHMGSCNRGNKGDGGCGKERLRIADH